MSPAAPEPPARVAFAIPAELRAEVERAIERARDEPGDRDRVRALIDAIVELTDTGLDYYFVHPLVLAGVGAVSLTTARVGVAAARRGMPRLIRRVVGSMSEAEVLEICDFLDGILIRS